MPGGDDFVSGNMYKLKNEINVLKLNFQRIVEVFTQKIFNMLSNIWVWDPGSEIRDPEKNLFRIQGSKRHRIPDPDPQHCVVHNYGTVLKVSKFRNPKIGLFLIHIRKHFSSFCKYIMLIIILILIDR